MEDGGFGCSRGSGYGARAREREKCEGKGRGAHGGLAEKLNGLREALVAANTTTAIHGGRGQRRRWWHCFGRPAGASFFLGLHGVYVEPLDSTERRGRGDGRGCARRRRRQRSVVACERARGGEGERRVREREQGLRGVSVASLEGAGEVGGGQSSVGARHAPGCPPDRGGR